MNAAAMPRPALLVSVRSADEALAALAGGADVIDVKEPAAGSLGAASPSVCGAIAAVVGQQKPWTMACGELAAGADRLAEHLAATWRALATGGAEERPFPWAIKVGLAGCGHGQAWRRELAAIRQQLPPGVGQVLVIYADAKDSDAPTASAVIELAAELRAEGVLVDTFDKGAAGLLGHCSVPQLQAWQQAAVAAGSRFAVAGKLRVEEFSTVHAINADIIAVRSAVCSQGRSGPVEPLLVQRACQALGRSSAGEPPLKTGNSEKRS